MKGSSETRKRTKTSTSKITKKVYIRASSTTVYRALTEPKELIHWFCDRASLNLCEGGEFVAHWRREKSGQKGRAVITRLVPGSALDLLWTDDGNGSPEKASSHTLCYEIQPKSEMTILIMTDRDDSVSDEETVDFLDKGWNSVLMDLKDYCERRERSVKVRNYAGSTAHNAVPD